MPGNEFRFFFGPHWSHADAIATRPEFAWCTVYCPEGTGYGEANRELYDRLSRGEFPVRIGVQLDKSTDNAFKVGELRLITGSDRAIELVDVSAEWPDLEALMSAAEAVRMIPYAEGPYPEVAQHALDAVKAFVLLNRERERHIIVELLRLNESYKNERILVRMGSVHYRVATLAAAAGLGVSVRYQRGSYGLLGLCYHYCACGVAVPADVLARFILSGAILRYVHRLVLSIDDGEEETVLWRICRRFTAGDITRLWEQLRQAPGSERDFLLSVLSTRCPPDDFRLP